MAKFPINNCLIEPKVWIEYQRINLEKDNFARQSWADAIHRYDLMPDGCNVRIRTKGKESIWEYLM